MAYWHLMLNLNVLLVSSRVLFPEVLCTNPSLSLSLLQVTDDKNKRLAVLSLGQHFVLHRGNRASISSRPNPWFTVPYLYSAAHFTTVTVHAFCSAQTLLA